MKSRAIWISAVAGAFVVSAGLGIAAYANQKDVQLRAELRGLNEVPPTTSRATRFDLSFARIRSASLTASSTSPSATDEMKARSRSSLFLGSARKAER